MQKTVSPIKSRLRRPYVVLLLLCLAGLVEAKTLYINDQVRVGIRPEPNNDSTPLAVVVSGDRLELLDTDAGYHKVRTEEGVEGWIKDMYTTAEMPAIVQLKALSKTTGGSDQKIKDLTQQLEMLQAANQSLSDELEQAREERGKMQMRLLTVKADQTSTDWMYWLAGLIVFTLISFAGGMYWYRHQAMKRLGGLRIYF